MKLSENVQNYLIYKIFSGINFSKKQETSEHIPHFDVKVAHLAVVLLVEGGGPVDVVSSVAAGLIQTKAIRLEFNDRLDVIIIKIIKH